MSEYKLVTDGSYSSSKKCGGIGIIFLKDDEIILEYSKQYRNITNNIAEMLAVMTGFKMIKGSIDSLTVITDSMYVIGCSTLGWQRNKNKMLWNQFDKEFDRVKQLCPDIKFEYIKGHAGNFLNEIVDNLATKATQL